MSLVFFTDRDLGKRFPEILAAAGLAVKQHADRFAPDDEEWLRYVGHLWTLGAESDCNKIRRAYPR